MRFPRIFAARFLIRCGGFSESLAVAWLRPSDLFEFNRRRGVFPGGAGPLSPAGGYELTHDESALLRHLPCPPARILLLGDGRELQALMRMGYEVTPAHDLRLGGWTGPFDAAWFGGTLFSKVPGVKMRRGLLRQVATSLVPNGFLAAQFILDQRSGGALAAFFYRLFALLVLGNFHLQKGDAIREGREFSHAFHSLAEFRHEAQAAGFEIVFSQLPPQTVHGGAVAKIRNFV